LVRDLHWNQSATNRDDAHGVLLLLYTLLAAMLFVALRISPPQKLLVWGGHEKPPVVSH
jgi:hypothetical protein